MCTNSSLRRQPIGCSVLDTVECGLTNHVRKVTEGEKETLRTARESLTLQKLFQTFKYLLLIIGLCASSPSPSNAMLDDLSNQLRFHKTRQISPCRVQDHGPVAKQAGRELHYSKKNSEWVDARTCSKCKERQAWAEEEARLVDAIITRASQWRQDAEAAKLIQEEKEREALEAIAAAKVIQERLDEELDLHRETITRHAPGLHGHNDTSRESIRAWYIAQFSGWSGVPTDGTGYRTCPVCCLADSQAMAAIRLQHTGPSQAKPQALLIVQRNWYSAVAKSL